MRRAFRVDANQSRIAKSLRELGCSVHITASLGNGFPDMLVTDLRGHYYLFEVKDPDQPPSKRNLTDKESLFRDSWRGPIYTIESLSDALIIMRMI